MTPKIIYMTNIDRRYFMMRRALDELIADGEMPAFSQVVKTEDGSVWSASWEEKLRGSALVMIRFMGKYDPYEVLDGVYAFSLAGRDPVLHGCGGIGRGGVHRAGRGKGHRGYEGVLVLWGADELQESVALCAFPF